VVVAATGTTTRPLFRQVAYDLPIESEYHQVAILRNAPGMKGNGCACIDLQLQLTFAPMVDKFLVGISTATAA
jgi:hypothetical protein